MWKVGGILNKYFSEIIKWTKYWSDHPDTLFLGQSIAYKGNVIYNTLEESKVPMHKRLELPVFEDVQMGMSIGLALEGVIPISMFPRFDFLLCAMNQLVTHLDKFPLMSCGTITPKVIIKTLVGSTHPLHPGFQHCGDYTESLKMMLKNVDVIKIDHADQVEESYVTAINRNDKKSTLIVEMADLYGD